MKKELITLYRLLARSLKEMGLEEDSMIAIALMLRTEPQILTMLDWVMKHYKENPDEDRIIRIARRISEEVQ